MLRVKDDTHGPILALITFHKFSPYTKVIIQKLRTKGLTPLQPVTKFYQLTTTSYH